MIFTALLAWENVSLSKAEQRKKRRRLRRRRKNDEQEIGIKGKVIVVGFQTTYTYIAMLYRKKEQEIKKVEKGVNSIRHKIDR